jgi:hypothetical protein
VNEKTQDDEKHGESEQSWRRLKKPIHVTQNAPPLLTPGEGIIKGRLSLKGLVILGDGYRPACKSRVRKSGHWEWADFLIYGSFPRWREGLVPSPSWPCRGTGRRSSLENRFGCPWHVFPARAGCPWHSPSEGAGRTAMTRRGARLASCKSYPAYKNNSFNRGAQGQG